mgnify:CR=1 FL=1
MPKIEFKVGEIECRLPARPGWRGHIDRASWQRATKIALPAAYNEAPVIEVETSLAADPAVIWGDGAFDWGKKVTASRTRFAREISQWIQTECPGLMIGVRRSAFDDPPF